MRGLLDFAQGASNSAAGMVHAPVDLIAWALRKAGVPVPAAPVGGSDWMASRGLIAEPQNKVAGALGEAVGGLLPLAGTKQVASKIGGALADADILAAIAAALRGPR